MLRHSISWGDLFTLTDDLESALEEFVTRLYGMNETSHVNELRYTMFSMATRQEDMMPPNSDLSGNTFSNLIIKLLLGDTALKVSLAVGWTWLEDH